MNSNYDFLTLIKATNLQLFCHKAQTKVYTTYSLSKSKSLKDYSLELHGNYALKLKNTFNSNGVWYDPRSIGSLLNAQADIDSSTICAKVIVDHNKKT